MYTGQQTPMWSYPHTVRPHIQCTFAAMRHCDAVFGRETRHADECRQGARDAHLLDYSFGHSEAYRLGRSATLVCPPSYDEAWATRFTSCDPRLGLLRPLVTESSCTSV